MPAYLSLDDFKQYARIDGADQDATCNLLLDAAEDYLGSVENGVLGRPVEATEFVETFDSFDGVSIKHPDEVSAISVDYDGNTLGNIYSLVLGRLMLGDGEAWPDANVVTVTYTAGWPSIPKQVLMAGYFIAATYYDARDSGEISEANLRRMTSNMLNGYRRTKI